MNKFYYPSTSVDDNFVSIPLVDISVAAGCSGYDNPDYLEVIDSINPICRHGKSVQTIVCKQIPKGIHSHNKNAYKVERLLETEWFQLLK